MNPAPRPDPYADRKGDYIVLYSGARFYPLDFRSSDIHVADIAHHLAQANRFRGALAQPVSVAQHAFLVSWIAELLAEPKLKFHAAWQGLHHDDSEAYFGDTPRPFKRCPGLIDTLVERDAALQTLIFRKFGCYYPDLLPEVKYADDLLLQFEARELNASIYEVLRGKGPENFGDFGVLRNWQPWSFLKAKAMYLNRHAQLEAELKNNGCENCTSSGFSPRIGRRASGHPFLGCDFCAAEEGEELVL